MTSELTALIITAASIGFFHTLLGPDHYLPFIAISKAGNWRVSKTLLLTILCGIGHVLSSVVLGLIGIAFGTAVAKLEFIESFRGDLAAWALIAFGLVYFVWGLKRAAKNIHHHHHHHHHQDESEGKKTSLTPWILFIVFVLGPCEPLIPILMYPAAKSSLTGMVVVASVFGVVTITTMTAIVYTLLSGTKLFTFPALEKYSHALAGFAILLCGVAIRLGL
jgi:nickel/cobalt exporter